MTLTVGVLETLFTADTKAFDKKATEVKRVTSELDKSGPQVKVGAETKGALADMVKVETAAKKITDAKVVARVDANIDSAQKRAATLRTDLKVLASLPTDVTVTADIARATKALAKVEARLDGLRSARTEMVVVADVKAAERAIDQVAKKAGDAGAKGGADAGEGLSSGIIAALATIPVAGAVVGIGAAIGKSLADGLQVEVRSDLLTARTGLDPLTVAKVARVAGEAYAGNFGESIAANMDTARVSIQSGLLNPGATARDSQQVIQSLDGVAQIIGEDIPRVARSAAQILKTGLAANAAGAFDLIVKGSQAGLNVSEDFLDTLDEYSTQFRKLGIDGPQSLGLLRQAVQAGARDTDTAADALKEFAIRAVDGSELTAESFAGVGLSATEMSAAIAKGGPEANAALDATLDRLRAVEDPALRAQLAVGLFGTKAEDLGDALFAMDLSSAVDQLGQVAGVAQSAVAALGDNAAGKIASAQRNIEVAADGIKGALATAFGPQIEGFATFVTENREAVIQFLLDIANGALDAGRALVNGAADATEGFGDFVGTAGPAVLGFIQSILEGIDKIPFVDLGDAVEDFKKMKDTATESFAAFDEGSEKAADSIRTNLIENGIDPAQERLNDVGIDLVTQAAVHDASMRLAQSIDSIGYAADGSTLAVAEMVTGTGEATVAIGDLDGQVKTAVESLDAQSQAALAAGTTQEELTAQYNAGRDALVRQLTAMGLTEQQAQDLVTAYGAIPGKVDTLVTANTAQAQADIDRFARQRIVIKAEISASGGSVYQTASGARLEGKGHILEPMARGAFDPMDPIAQMVRPNTWRIVGDRLDVDEAYIPLDGSQRSQALWHETGRRMGMSAGDVRTTGAPGSVSFPDTVRLDPASVQAVADAVVAGSQMVAHGVAQQQQRTFTGSRGSR